MAETWRLWGPMVLAALVALPVAALGVMVVARWRIRTGTPPGWAWTATGAEFGMVIGTLPWIWMILTPRPTPSGIELVPVRGLVAVCTAGPSDAVTQIGGNLLVFAAFGALAPIRWPLRLPAVAACAAAGSAVVEVLQHLLDLGRVSSVDDVALNTLGAVLAALTTGGRRGYRDRGHAMSAAHGPPPDGSRSVPRRLPALGRRGGGWVSLQVAFFVAAVLTGVLGMPWPATVRPWLAVLGGAVALAGVGLLLLGGAGLGRQLTPFPRPVADGALRRNGAYGLVRHPMYGGVMVAILGWTLLSSPLVLAPLVLAAGFLDAKSRREETWLAELHPGYATYRLQVPRRFLPWIW